MKNRIKILTSILFLFFIITSIAFADQSVTFTSIRRMAMGGTFAANGDAEDVLWGNPANLAFVSDRDIGIFKLKMGANKELINKLSNFLDIMNMNDEVDMLNAVNQQLMPFNGNVDFSLMPFSLIKQNMGMAVISQTKLNIRILRPTSPRVEYNGISDNAFYFGYSRQIPRNMILGIAVKFLCRFQTLDQTTQEDKVTVGLTQLVENGMNPSYTQIKGAGIDVGIIMPIKLPGLGDCKLGIVATDLLTRLTGVQKIVSGDVTTSVPFSNTIPKTITMGLSWNKGGTLFALDWELVSPHKVTAKRFHFGLEKKLSNLLTLRAGLNEGFWVGGISCKLKGFNIDYVYSKEELGSQLLENASGMHYIKIGGQI